MAERTFTDYEFKEVVDALAFNASQVYNHINSKCNCPWSSTSTVGHGPFCPRRKALFWADNLLHQAEVVLKGRNKSA